MRLVIAALLLLLISNPGLADSTTAEAAFRRGDPAAAYEDCKTEAEKGDAECQNLVGMLFQKGLGVPSDLNEALRLFTAAAAKKLPEAEAARWFGLAAAQGDPIGEHRLALLLLPGKGVERDTGEAVELL